MGEINGQPKRDKQAGWHIMKDSRRNLKSTYGYSVHASIEEYGFIQRQTVTTDNMHVSVEAILSCLGMKPSFIRMRLTVLKIGKTNWNVLAFQLFQTSEIEV